MQSFVNMKQSKRPSQLYGHAPIYGTHYLSNLLNFTLQIVQTHNVTCFLNKF